MFYNIPVNTELAESVELGLYPATPAIVHAHLPAVARPARRLSEGMRLITLLCNYDQLNLGTVRSDTSIMGAESKYFISNLADESQITCPRKSLRTTKSTETC